MSVCTDNTRLGLIGCGAPYTGNAGHSVAEVPWSTHPDGRAHVTFASDEACLACWSAAGMRDPATLRGRDSELLLEQDGRGYWRRRKRSAGEVSSDAEAEP